MHQHARRADNNCDPSFVHLLAAREHDALLHQLAVLRMRSLCCTAKVHSCRLMPRYHRVIARFLEHGAKPNVVDALGRTPLLIQAISLCCCAAMQTCLWCVCDGRTALGIAFDDRKYHKDRRDRADFNLLFSFLYVLREKRIYSDLRRKLTLSMEAVTSIGQSSDDKRTRK